MGDKMTNAPVYFVLAQVRFNPVLTLDQYVPAIQNSLRKTGFPDFQKGVVPALNFGLVNQQIAAQPVGVFSPQSRYIFMDEQKTTGFLLDQASLILQTTHYDTFEHFLSQFILCLDILHKNAELSFSERLGLRYLDAAIPRQDEDISKYLQPYTLGLYKALTDRELVHSFSETRTQKEKSTLVSRAVIYKQIEKNMKDLRVAFPPDIQPEPLRLMDRFSAVTGVYAIFDTDCWYEDRERFDIGSIEGRFRYLHGEIRRSFDSMVTRHALEMWK
jgi:uncharacterized protein (TIGR04255 family)